MKNTPPEELAAKLRKAAAVLHPTNVGRIIGVEAVRQAHEALDTEGASIGESWRSRLEGTERNSRRLLLDKGILYRSIRYEQRGGDIVVGVDGGKVPYAQLHNEGGTVPVTPKMRSYFWAKYYEYSGRADKQADGTKDSQIKKYKTTNATAELYKRLALTKKTALDIPKRTFLQPNVVRLRIAVAAEIEAQLKRILP